MCVLDGGAVDLMLLCLPLTVVSRWPSHVLRQFLDVCGLARDSMLFRLPLLRFLIAYSMSSSKAYSMSSSNPPSSFAMHIAASGNGHSSLKLLLLLLAACAINLCSPSHFIPRSDYTAEAKAAFEKVKNLLASDGWVGFEHKSDPDIKSSKKPSESGIDVVRATGIIEGANPKTLRDQVFSQSFEEKRKVRCFNCSAATESESVKSSM